MGDSPSSSDSEASSGAAPDTSTSSEKWLVRILLALAFGLAFGIEGMTLVRSYFVDGASETEETAAPARPTLTNGTVLLPSAGPDVRAHRIRLTATSDEWVFTLTVRPDTVVARPYTLSFDRLTTGNGTTLTTAPSHTWAPPDTASFAASWTLPVGQRPDALTVTATARIGPDSTTAVTRTVSFGHIPVRQQ